MTSEEYNQYWNSKEGLTRSYNMHKQDVLDSLQRRDFEAAKYHLAECEKIEASIQNL
jgi:hypothetical protein